ncbi:alcohol dehydrogenase catalytic domain-containing protein [Streptomyces sp. TP-A0356]|uniref:alcohol dehydrogenase catalytic domain-containing protein n=1 Tax=Streptomyces sp. TP-A0356 TaxID=1359208 RepID=UPI0006E20870|nr:hypothetical protein [Streptomyces sp. TP-A0356]
MRALTPTGIDDKMVEITEVPEVEPRPNELVVRVEAFSVNRGETFLLASPRPGWRPGQDVAGRVVRAVADGTGPAVGTRVVGHPWGAGWAERAAVAVSNVAVLPDSVPTATAAALPLAGITALRLIRRARPVYGDRVLITGASFGVGHYFTELASAAGAEVTAVGVHPSVHRSVQPKQHHLPRASSRWGRRGHPLGQDAGQEPPSRAPYGRRHAMGLRPTLDRGPCPGGSWLSGGPGALEYGALRTFACTGWCTHK